MTSNNRRRGWRRVAMLLALLGATLGAYFYFVDYSKTAPSPNAPVPRTAEIAKMPAVLPNAEPAREGRAADSGNRTGAEGNSLAKKPGSLLDDRKMAFVSGRVLARESKEPLPNAHVSVAKEKVPVDAKPTLTSEADERGDFWFRIEPGRYVLWAANHNFPTLQAWGSSVLTLDLKAGDNVVDIVLEAPSPKWLKGFSGTVVSDSGEKLRDAEISVGTQKEWKTIAKSDDAGRFQVSSSETLTSMTMHPVLRAEHPGFAPAFIQAAEKQSEYEFVLRRAGSWSGLVVASDHAPLQGAAISIGLVGVWPTELTGPTQTAATDSFGRFRLPLLSPGRYDVAAEKDGFVSEKIRVEIVPGENDPRTFTLKRAGSVRVVVLNAGRETVSTSLRIWGGSSYADRKITDDQGIAVFENTPSEGEYEVGVKADGVYHRQRGVLNGKDIEFRIPSGAKLKLHVASSASGVSTAVKLSLWRAANPNLGLSYVYSNEMFSTEGVYEIQVPSEVGLELYATTRDGAVGHLFIDPIRAETESEVHISLHAPIVLRGRVLSATDKAPLVGVSVMVHGYHEEFPETDAQGEFTFSRVPPGNLTLRFRKDGSTKPIYLPIAVGPATSGRFVDFVLPEK